jgi:hypothetical protein
MNKEERKIYKKAYYLANKEKIKKRANLYWENNKERVKENVRVYIEKNKEKIKKDKKLYWEKNKEKIKKKRKSQSKKIKKNAKIYRENNKEKIRRYSKAYGKSHKKERNDRNRERYNRDHRIRLNSNISRAIRKDLLKNSKNGKHWETLVGYTFKQLRKHLEKQFTDGMNWNNYGKGGWTVDHKIPLSVFNFETTEHQDFQKAWALKNLQPLWAEDNFSKGAKLTKHFQPSLLL